MVRGSGAGAERGGRYDLLVPVFEDKPLKRARGLWPPVVRRWVYVWIGLSLIFSLAALAWLVLRRPLGLPRGGWYRLVPLVLAVMPVAVTAWWLLRTRGLRRSVRATKGCLCTRCAYELTNLPPSGTCPECGHGYNVEADRVMWAALGEKMDDDATRAG